ncbi:MAG: caspase family protein [Microcoleaceae cyanobacterium]
MSLLKRRHFLQFAGSTLAAMGLSQLDFFQQTEQYGRVLAESTPRKLALLVGINNYDAVTPLNGCLTDVELQQHLLIHRFGFNPNDIMIVADNANFKPTRENIIQAFESHLIEQAKPGDVVVFHFSGHGSLVRDPFPLNLAECSRENSINNSCQYNGTILPQDAESIRSDNPEIPVSHLMGQTLFLLKNRVKTDKFTMILDSCHSGGGTRGNVVVRAARLTRNSQILIPSETELEFQQQQLSKLGWSENELIKRRQAGIAKGVALGSAGRTQEAIDADFGTFYAGAFTYLLTRYLWQLTSTQMAESVYINLRRSTNSLARSKHHTTAQIPTFEYQPGSNFNQQPLYFIELETPSAEAVITTVRGETIEFWLGGVASQNLKNSDATAIYSVLDELGEVVAEIEQTSRVEGLFGIGKQISGDTSAIKKDRLLREKIVGIPANPKLQLALDESLEADATTANTELQSNQRIELVPRNKLSESGYFLGRFTESYQQQQAEINPDMELPPISSIGLFQADLTPDTASFGRLEEPIIKAINRLQPRLRRLLANQILGQLLSAGQGSPLKVKAEVSGGGQVLEVASRGLDEAKAANIPVQFRSGTQLKIKVSNESNQDLYLAILLISAQGEMDPFHPTNWDAPEEESLFEAAEAVELPRQGESTLEVTGTSGFPEIMILASQEPLRNTLKALQQIAASRGKSRGRLGGLRGEEPLDVIDSLLADVARSGRSETGGFQQRTISYETSTMAVLSAVLEVVG